MRDYDGKTAAERVSERRQRLIDAGIELFGEHGYAGTSIRAVLRKSGLRDRYFAESFPDLDSLLAAVYDQIIDEELTAARAAIEATSGASDGARAMMDAAVRYLDANPGRARIKLQQALGGGPVAQQHRQEGMKRLAQTLAELLPVTRDDDDRQRFHLAMGITAAGDAYLLAWLDGQAGISRQDVVDLVATFFDSVAARLTLEAAG